MKQYLYTVHSVTVKSQTFSQFAFELSSAWWYTLLEKGKLLQLNQYNCNPFQQSEPIMFIAHSRIIVYSKTEPSLLCTVSNQNINKRKYLVRILDAERRQMSNNTAFILLYQLQSRRKRLLGWMWIGTRLKYEKKKTIQSATRIHYMNMNMEHNKLKRFFYDWGINWDTFSFILSVRLKYCPWILHTRIWQELCFLVWYTMDWKACFSYGLWAFEEYYWKKNIYDLS